MDFNECTLNLKYIKSVMDLFAKIEEKAQQLNEEKDKQIYAFDQKNFRKLWSVQKKQLRKKLVQNQRLSSDYFLKKFQALFLKKTQEVSEVERLDKFFDSLNDETLILDLNNELKFGTMELITPKSYAKTFVDRVENVIESVEKYPGISRGFHLEKKDLPLLRQMKSDAEKESNDFILAHYKETFDNFVQEQLDTFVKENEEDRLKTTLFNVFYYDPKFLVDNLTFTRMDSIRNKQERHKIVYDLCSAAYQKQFKPMNILTYDNLSQMIKNEEDPITLLDKIDPKTLMFEERNSLSELNLFFSVYTDTHKALEKIIIEMKERNLIPKNVEDDLKTNGKDFSQFFTKIVNSHELHKKLHIELPQKKEQLAVRARANKI